MKIEVKDISDRTKIDKIRSITNQELNDGKLYAYKKSHPGAQIVITPDHKNEVDCWGSIFDKNGELICRFSINKDLLTISILAVK